MKQHITPEQWKELSYAQQEKFVSVIEPNQNAFIGNSGCSECGRDCLPHIGQLIEYIIDSKENWRLETVTSGLPSMCDDLWEEVKQLLEQT